MATLEKLTTADIKKVVNKKSLGRARSYVAHVKQAARNGRSLSANVGKSRSYAVEIDVLNDGIRAVCNCPYDWGGYCKHIGAVLLKWLDQPGSFVIEMPASRDANAIIQTFLVAPPKTAVPSEKPDWITNDYAARRQKDNNDLSGWLNNYKLKELRQMAKQNGWRIKGTRKADIIQQIISQMLKPGNALRNLLNLDAEHRQVYDALGLLYGDIPFQNEHIALLATQWGDLKQHEKMNDYITHLYDAGLAIPGRFRYGYWRKIAFIPDSIIRITPPLLEDRIAEASVVDDVDGDVLLAEKRPFLQRLHQILLLLEQSHPPLRQPMPRPRLEKFHDVLRAWDYIPEEVRDAQNNRKLDSSNLDFNLTVPPPHPLLPDETVARLTPIAGSEAKLKFIHHLLLTAGLLQPGSPVTVWREVKTQFLRHNEAAQWAILAHAYFALDTWSEIWLLLAERPSLRLKHAQVRYTRAESPDRMYQQLAVFRAQLLHLLANLPDGRWFNVSDAADLLRPLWLRFDNWAWKHTQHYGKELAGWFLAESDAPLNPAEKEADWDKAQGAFIRQVIQGPLHWMGLADICVQNGRLAAFRLHGVGDLFFDKVESVPLNGNAKAAAATEKQLVSSDAVTVEGTVIIVDPTAVATQAHNYLDDIAVLGKAGTDRFTYKLSVNAVHEAFESGQTLGDLLDGWEKWLIIPMPDTVYDQLKVWQKAYGQVRLYEKVTVIEFGDAYALTEMKAATSLNKHLIAEISPTLIIIPANTVNLLAAELEKAGYTPKKTNNEQ